ncbi:class I SAM-dependent methyltransferase [Tessaracoccus terricola]
MSEAASGVRWYGSRRPGASEWVLEHSHGGDHDPYRWLARAVADSATKVLDLACGTGALTRRLVKSDRTVVGVDLSDANLEAARAAGPGTYVRADVGYLPFADDSFDAVVTSLGLGVVADRARFLKEAARVLRPGGVFAALSPSLRPFNAEDLRISSQLAGYLRVTPQLPGLSEFRAKKMLAEAGLKKVEDSRSRYHYEVASREDAEFLLAGLRQAPDRSRSSAALEFLAARAEAEPFRVPLPMRRIVALK